MNAKLNAETCEDDKPTRTQMANIKSVPNGSTHLISPTKKKELNDLIFSLLSRHLVENPYSKVKKAKLSIWQLGDGTIGLSYDYYYYYMI